MRNREYGSDFHYINDAKFRTVGQNNHVFSTVSHLYYSGRAALYAIIENGIRQFAWKKIYVPSYYCHEVYDFIRPLAIQIEYYQYHPFSKRTDFSFVDKKENVLLAVNYFGIDILDVTPYKNMVVIQDLTHDLSGIDTNLADYCFGSLRKVLPLPVGGFVWAKSAKQLPMPVESLSSEDASLQKLTAMYLKTQYFERDMDVKPLFRALYTDGEEAFARDRTNQALPSIIRPYLYSLNIQRIIEAKRNNAAVISRLLNSNDRFEVVTSPLSNEFGCILRFKSLEDRDCLRHHLITHAVYPFVLWPNQIQADDRRVSDSLLFLHIDFRYDEEDMRFLAETINNFSGYA